MIILLFFVVLYGTGFGLAWYGHRQIKKGKKGWV